MRSEIDEDFLECFRRLPKVIQQETREAYKLFKRNPRSRSLYFKLVHKKKRIYSVRVGLWYRALGVLEDDLITWFWIGSHAEYDKLLELL